jgi:hypothetical protein
MRGVAAGNVLSPAALPELPACRLLDADLLRKKESGAAIAEFNQKHSAAQIIQLSQYFGLFVEMIHPVTITHGPFQHAMVPDHVINRFNLYIIHIVIPPSPSSFQVFPRHHQSNEQDSDHLFNSSLMDANDPMLT